MKRISRHDLENPIDSSIVSSSLQANWRIYQTGQRNVGQTEMQHSSETSHNSLHDSKGNMSNTK